MSVEAPIDTGITREGELGPVEIHNIEPAKFVKGQLATLRRSCNLSIDHREELNDEVQHLIDKTIYSSLTAAKDAGAVHAAHEILVDAGFAQDEPTPAETTKMFRSIEKHLILTRSLPRP